MTTTNTTAHERDLARRDAGLLMIRAILGLVLMFHGAQKLFGAFGGPGIEGMAGFNASLGIPFPELSAYLAASAELFGGLAIAVGLLSRLAAIPVVFTMLVAGFVAHDGFNMATGGGEYAFTIAVVTAAIGVMGPGRLTIGRLLERAGVRIPANAA
jgi:putative oxidoreductase